MKTIPLSQGKVAVIDDCDYEKVTASKWHALKGHCGLWYAVHTGRRNRKQVSIFMHRFITDAPDGLVVDHINGNGLDNRRKNLRVCTASSNRQNQQNRKRTGFVGVHKLKSGRHAARIQKDGKIHWLGTFDSPREAAMAYDRKALEFHGEHAFTNVL